MAQRNGFDDTLLTSPDGTISVAAIANIGFFDGTAVVWTQARMAGFDTLPIVWSRQPPGARSIMNILNAGVLPPER